MSCHSLTPPGIDSSIWLTRTQDIWCALGRKDREFVYRAFDRILAFAEKIEFIMRDGSSARGGELPGSDIDLCIYYDGENSKAARFRLRACAEPDDSRIDLQFFRLLPLYVRLEVFRGNIVYAKDLAFVYDVATETIRDCESFKHRLYGYTGRRAIQ